MWFRRMWQPKRPMRSAPQRRRQSTSKRAGAWRHLGIEWLEARQMLSASTAVGAEFQVNSYTTGSQSSQAGPWPPIRPATLWSSGQARARTAAATESTRSATMPRVRLRGASSGSIPTPPATRRSRRWPWTRPAILSSPGQSSWRRRQRLRRLCPALQLGRRGPGKRVPRQHLHDGINAVRRPAMAMDSAGDFVVSLGKARPGRQRLRRLCPAL